MNVSQMNTGTFGAHLRNARLKAHLSQEKLAEAIGVSVRSVHRWECDKAVPHGVSLERLCQFLHLSLDIPLVKTFEGDPPSRCWSLPNQRNCFFTGRDELLIQIHQILRPKGPAVVSSWCALRGLGGIGKTQVAIEYAYRHAQEYQAIFWLAAETTENLNQSLQLIADQLQLPESQATEQSHMVAAVQRWLATHADWLLIGDNVEDIKILKHFLPLANHGTVLLTTRRQALGNLARSIEVSTMSPEEGAIFLLRRTQMLPPEATGEQLHTLLPHIPGEYLTARTFVEMMGGLPLALDQVGAYVEETPCSLQEYLELYSTRQATLLARRGDAVIDHPASVWTTWSLSFEQVKHTNAAAADLLRLCAFLHSDEIPEELFRVGNDAPSELPELVATDLFQWHEVLRAISAYSLVKRNVEQHTFTMHRLVQAILQERMSESERVVWQQQTIQLLSAAFPKITPDVWGKCERLVPHVLYCTATIPEERHTQELAHLLCKTAEYLTERAQYEHAELLFQQVLRIQKRLLNWDNPQIADALSGLAYLYQRQGKYGQAASAFQQALSIHERASGEEPADIARDLTGLATAYTFQGKYEQAQPLYERALSIWKQELGPEHQYVAITLSGLANLYGFQDLYEQAEELYLSALHIYNQAEGPVHPRVAVSLNNLAEVYRALRKFEQAQSLYEQARCIWEQAQGPNHPDVAVALNNLAEVSKELGEYEQAQLLFERALHIWELVVGPELPLVAYTLTGLADLSRIHRQYEEAETLFTRALKIREAHLEPTHPDLAVIIDDLALLYCEQGRYAEAELLYQRSLTIWRQQLGASYLRTATTLDALATLYQAQGLLDQAEAFHQQALDVLGTRLGAPG